MLNVVFDYLRALSWNLKKEDIANMVEYLVKIVQTNFSTNISSKLTDSRFDSICWGESVEYSF